MAITLASNIASLRAQTDLRQTNQALSSTFERLSSGLRINSAADDPAGLQVADALRRDAALAAVALRNANDGISQASIADAALSEIGNVLYRMAELASQSSNGIYTNSQRSALQSEFYALGSEIDRISRTTEFNSVKLLSNSSSTALQVGLNGSSDSVINIESVISTLDSINLANAGSSALRFSIIGTTVLGAQTASQLALDAVNAAINSISVRRGVIGAAESRLEHAVNYLTIARENFVAAESRIRDADVAQEVAEMVRLQVLQQSEMAVLAQANQQPAQVLALLS